MLVSEAKRDRIPDGLGQCIAGLVGAQRLIRSMAMWQQERIGIPSARRYRSHSVLTECMLTQVDHIFVHMVGPIPQPAAA